MIDRWMPFALTGVIVLGEIPSLRKRDAASQKDHGSYWVFSLMLAAGYLVSFSLFARRMLPAATALGEWAMWAGVALTLAGTVFRVWAIRTLGEYFTVIVHVSPDQKVIESGPYRLLRHPSYTGAGLAALGVGLSMQNLASFLLIGVPFFVGVAYRIRIEETALVETIGAPYCEYMRRTKRLIPYVF